MIYLEDYDGSLIHEKFAYKKIGKQISTTPLGYLYISRGKMDVTTNLIDLEDKINNDYIYSEDALSLCWEIPNMTALGAVFFQRLFVHEIAKHLSKEMYGQHEINVDGDDIMVRKKDTKTFGKASVSITKSVNDTALGHLGLNINAGYKAPSFAFSFFFDDKTVETLAAHLEKIFKDILTDCFVATTKVI